MPRWINLPNLFTLLRLVLVPFVIQAILDGRSTLALALFGVAAFTDILDGAAARRFGLATQTGAYLDPIADKCLLSGVFLALAAARVVALVVRGRGVRPRSVYPAGCGRIPAVHPSPEVSAQRLG